MFTFSFVTHWIHTGVGLLNPFGTFLLSICKILFDSLFLEVPALPVLICRCYSFVSNWKIGSFNWIITFSIYDILFLLYQLFMKLVALMQFSHIYNSAFFLITTNIICVLQRQSKKVVDYYWKYLIGTVNISEVKPKAALFSRLIVWLHYFIPNEFREK